MFNRYTLFLACSLIMLQESLVAQDHHADTAAIASAVQVVNMGFVSQRQDQITGSVVKVEGDELAKTPMPALSTSFAGRLSGLYVNETSSEWARVRNEMYIRGGSTGALRSPILVVDGLMILVRPELIIDNLNANEIESVVILKDASSLALYGIRGADGVIVVNTKRGRAVDLSVQGRIDYSLQEFSEKPRTLSALEYINLRNQASYNDDNSKGKNHFFSEDIVKQYASNKADPAFYPNNNWYNKYTQQFAQAQRVSLNLQGGSDKISFFSNVNFMNQNTNLITEKNDKYNPSPSFQWVNFRSNIDAKLNNIFKVDLNVAANINRERGQEDNLNGIYASLFELPPTIFEQTPRIVDPVTGEVLHKGGDVVTSENSASSLSPYGRLNRQGYRIQTNTNIYSKVGLEADLNWFIDGLSLRGDIGFQTNSPNTLATTQNYERWMRQGSWDELEFIKKGTDESTPLAVSKLGRTYYNLNYQLSAQYKRSFGKHDLSGFVYGMYQRTLLVDPLLYKRIYSGLLGSYAYDNKYLLTLGTGYSGSDNFARGRRFHMTPSIAAGWIVSNEEFAKQSNWLEFLKLKASYGINANDQTGMARYGYLPNITGTTEVGTGNPLYEPEKVKKVNIGVEIESKSGIRFATEWYDFRIDNILVNSTAYIPSYNGLVSAFPQINAGRAKNSGFEIELGYKKQFNSDFRFQINGFLNINNNKILKSGEAVQGDDYAYQTRTEGFPIGQSWGYKVDYSAGSPFFNTQNELDSYLEKTTYSFGVPRLGDLKYVDVNKDGTLDSKDQIPLGNGSFPRYVLGLNLAFQYKGFGFSALLNGRFKILTFEHAAIGVWESATVDGIYSPLHLTAWTQERYEAGLPINLPAVSLNYNTTNAFANDFSMLDRSFVRLRNVEFSYQFPRQVLEKIKLEQLRVFVSGHNLLTFDKLSDYGFGPENRYNTVPPARVFNFGFNIGF